MIDIIGRNFWLFVLAAAALGLAIRSRATARRESRILEPSEQPVRPDHSSDWAEYRFQYSAGFKWISLAGVILFAGLAVGALVAAATWALASGEQIAILVTAGIGLSALTVFAWKDYRRADHILVLTPTGFRWHNASADSPAHSWNAVWLVRERGFSPEALELYDRSNRLLLRVSSNFADYPKARQVVEECLGAVSRRVR